MSNANSNFRSLKSFGISGILNEDSIVFYQTLFNSSHLGKISDLLVFNIKNEHFDELRFRSLVNRSVLYFFHSYNKDINSDLLKKGSRPILFECGIDLEKVAIGLNFSKASNFQVEGILDKISSDDLKVELDKINKELDIESDQTVIRYQTQTGVLEIIFILYFNIQVYSDDLKKSELVILNDEESESSPEPREYIHLGDLDFDITLTDKDLSDPSLSVFRVSGSDSVESQEEYRVVSDPSGVEKRGSSQWKVKSLIKSFSSALSDAMKGIVNAGRSKSKLNNKKIEVSHLSEGRSLKINSTDSKKIILDTSLQPIEKESSNLILHEESKVLEKKFEKLDSGSSGDDFVKEIKPGIEKDLESEYGKLLNEIQTGGLEKLMMTLKDKSRVMIREISNPKVEIWMSEIRSRLITERARLAEMTKTLNSSVRIKEIEFRNKVAVLEEEIKRKNVQLAQRNQVLSQNRENLSTLVKNIDKIKESMKNQTDQTNSENSSMKNKYLYAQKMLHVSREENLKLTRKLEEMKVQLNAASSLAQQQSVSSNEYSFLKDQHTRLQRKIEEHKKINIQVMEQLKSLKKEKSRAEVNHSADEMKKKMDSALRMNAMSRDQVEEMRKRIDQLQQKEAKMKAEILKMQNEIKRLVSSEKKRGSDQLK